MTRDFHRPLTPKKLSQLAESVTQASALEPGLTMVVGPYSELVHLVYATMVKELVQGLTLPLFRAALNPRFTRTFYAVPRTSAARTASG